MEVITGVIIGAAVVGFIWACTSLFKPTEKPQPKTINEAYRETFQQ